ncbi:hypothetical protein ES703_123782 [subsurface metagenome]
MRSRAGLTVPHSLRLIEGPYFREVAARWLLGALHTSTYRVGERAYTVVWLGSCAYWTLFFD